jgi:hypothetical protein
MLVDSHGRASNRQKRRIIDDNASRLFGAISHWQLNVLETTSNP